ncbi:MAG TPA: MaoC family dehydratase N-terminal domain-containing protein [Candidatus Margulisiibacteriota bacterium]|nr:MaoC family dehydratase N-terminal domain-containing protein [Candidatus Margulisiibacteriota bacterium]
MLHIPESLLGHEVDLGCVTVTAQMITDYTHAVGDTPAVTGEAPPTFCLSMRRGMTPAVTLPPDVFGVYGGHDLEFCHPIRAGEQYRITGKIAEVYEKIGRSGTLTVVMREAAICDSRGTLAARIVERQIVRQRPGTAAPAAAFEPSHPNLAEEPEAAGPPAANRPVADIDLGHELGPWHRATPSAAVIARYAASADIPEPLFTDASTARGLGYRGVVVPGPMLAAFMEQFVRRELPGWRIERLSATFRVPTITGDSIVLSGVITERHELADGERIVCDLVIEHSDGERAVTGTATLRQPAAA